MATKWITSNDGDIGTMMSHYEKVKDALEGLKEIIDINFSEKNIYHELASDNLKAVKENIDEMLKYTNSSRELKMRLRELDIEDPETEESVAF